MKKNSLVTSLPMYVVSFVIGAGVFGGFMFATAPEQDISEGNTLPVPNVKRVNLNASGFLGASNPMGNFDVEQMSLDRPELPDIPDAPATADVSTGEKIIPNVTVRGVLPPDMAVVEVNNESLVVKVGEKTPAGNVSKVFADGVYIGGMKFELAKISVENNNPNGSNNFYSQPEKPKRERNADVKNNMNRNGNGNGKKGGRLSGNGSRKRGNEK